MRVSALRNKTTKKFLKVEKKNMQILLRIFKIDSKTLPLLINTSKINFKLIYFSIN